MSFILFKTSTPHTSLLPKHAAMNTFAIKEKGGATRNVACTDFALAVRTFYSTLVAMLHSQWRWDITSWEAVDLLDPMPRVPFDGGTLAGPVVSTTGQDWPPEVAIAISFQGAPGSGVNIRRRTGRIFLGPLQSTISTDQPNIPTATLNSVRDAFGPIMVGTNYELNVYSRYNHYLVPVGRNIGEKDSSGNPVFSEHPEALPSSFTPVVSGWVDNAWDTQRRRGIEASARTALVPS